MADSRPKSVNANRSNRKIKTLGSQFKTQLSTLIDTLNRTTPHFIRCLKPNNEKIGRKYDSVMMLTQLRYAGFLEVCRIRQLGYPCRMTFQQFVRHFQLLSRRSQTPSELLDHLLQSQILSSGQCLIGINFVFMKDRVNEFLQSQKEKITFQYLAKIQRYYRMKLQRKRYLSFKKIISTLHNILRDKKFEILEDTLIHCVDLPYEGKQLSVVKEASKILKCYQEEIKLSELLCDALKQRQLICFETVIKSVQTMRPSIPTAVHSMQQKSPSPASILSPQLPVHYLQAIKLCERRG